MKSNKDDDEPKLNFLQTNSSGGMVVKP